MFAIAIAAGALTTLFVALLAIPLVLDVEAERLDTFRASWRVRWLFGLLDIRSSRHHPGPDESERAPSTRPARSGRARRRSLRIGIAILRTRGLFRRVGRLAAALCRKIRIEQFHLRTAFGLENPADTGVAYGLLSPWLAMASARGFDIECRPMFLESGLRGVVQGSVQVRPLLVVGALVSFACSPPVLRAVRSAWRARK